MIIEGISDGLLLYATICFILVFYMIYAVINNILSFKKSRNYFYHDESLVDENECPICLENSNNNAYFICRHNCCVKCINALINRNKPNNFDCFLCRRKITMIMYNKKLNLSEEQRNYERNIIDYNIKNLSSYHFYVRKI